MLARQRFLFQFVSFFDLLLTSVFMFTLLLLGVSCVCTHTAGTYERKRLERLRAEARFKKEAVQAKQLAKEEKLRRLWKLENGLEDDSDSDEDDAYGFANQPPSRSKSRVRSGSSGARGGGGGTHSPRRGMSAPNSSSDSIPPIVAGPPTTKDGSQKRRDREQYVGRNGKKPTSWTTGMLWSEHYNQ